MEKILIIEDDQSMGFALVESLKEKGYDLELVVSAEDALEKLKETSYDLIITDVRLPGISGIELLGMVLEKDPRSIVIIMTAFGKKEVALKAVKAGAYDYFTKPFKLEEMEIIVERALEKRMLEKEIHELKKDAGRKDGFDDIIGQSGEIRKVLDLVDKIARIDTTVLITGESGTGKELIANAIYQRSDRYKKPFIKVNCAALPENLLESELFGHERGAFTSAYSQRPGKFELAHEGTIFLDEIGDMTLATQSKVLRVLEQREIERLGGSKTIKVDIRVIAATNIDLQQAIKEKQFREDLYFRLNVFPVYLPPLRERKEDIPLLINHYINDNRLRLGSGNVVVTKNAIESFLGYQWPGNIRELRNVIERAMAFAENGIINSSTIALSFKREESASEMNIQKTAASLNNILNETERQLILNALHKTEGLQTEAAKILGITEKNLWKKIKKHDVDVKGIKRKTDRTLITN